MNDLKVIKHSLAGYKKQTYFVISFTFCLMLTTLFIFIFFVKPEYQSTSQLLIGDTSSFSHVEKEKGQVDPLMTEAYATFLKSPEVLEKVNEELKIADSPTDLRKQVHVSYTDYSPVLTITIFSHNKNEASKIANTLAVVFQEKVNTSPLVDHVNVISFAPMEGENRKPSQSAIILYTGIVTVIGLVFSILLIFGVHMIKNAASRDRETENREQQLQTVFK
ncbi:modulator of YwqD protein tyrosine kinase activity [Planococcus donghaensis MPA1U2]|uniref:Modulator of YwqD protein tyrosine kinase activity n=1 Tax=Planococcus donghaensis MPA1U2 TaxID=933115 RepID=E7RKV8_9BACL|nr:Wzz/FepE/Etk N-terminal domain-containing protein [Planococcus donghaensis]EGA88352.1 modulator of YwqD protein tyrosine kinase activity [Planococcus donghaensis MPA1U2]